MPHIFPCYRCPLRDGCDQRAEFARKSSGTGARSIAFHCPRLKSEIRPGRRIVISVPTKGEWHSDYDGEGWYAASRREVSATVTMAGPKHTFVCVVDPGQILEEHLFDNDHHSTTIDSVRFKKRQAHYRIVRFLDQRDAKLCSAGNILRDGGCDTSSGHCDCKQFAEFAA